MKHIGCYYLLRNILVSIIGISNIYSALMAFFEWISAEFGATITVPVGHSHIHAWSPLRFGWVTFVRTKVTRKNIVQTKIQKVF